MTKMRIFFAVVFLSVYPMQASEPQEVIISGKVLNYAPESGDSTVTVIVNDYGRMAQLSYPSGVESSGRFQIEFGLYLPQDVMIKYKTNFRVIVHPGDSLHIEFDGSTNRRTKIFDSIKFAGSRAKTNSILAKYLHKYFTIRPTDSLLNNKKKTSTPEQYIQFQDSIRIELYSMRKEFLNEYDTDEDISLWTLVGIDFEYYTRLLLYPIEHRLFNDLSEENWNVPASYYEFISSMPPLETRHLINTGCFSLINGLLYSYIKPSFINNIKTKNIKQLDSLIVNDILNISHESIILKQLLLCHYFNTEFERYEIETFEKYSSIVRGVFTNDFLYRPLMEHYREIKQSIEQPEIAKDEITNNIQDESPENVFRQILENNSNKVIYVNCWATWCSPCKKNFPNLLKMIGEYNGRDIAFVHLCFLSEMEHWKAVLTKYDLPGEHYLLNNEQSRFFQEKFEMEGYPTYAIINRSGEIIRSGIDLRPNTNRTLDVIEEIL